MRKIIVAVTLLLGTLFAQGQINIVRYNDKFSYLKNDTIPKKSFEKIKYIHLYKTINISFGGELREQFQYYNNQNFGDVPPSFKQASTVQLWHRAMAHTNIELGIKLRIFAQFGSTFRFINHNPLTPEIDENKLSLHQAFIDYSFHKKWLVRLGRQEISYGNHRLITFREGPNTRLAFDAAIFKYHSEKRRIDIFAFTPVTSMQGIFDDKSFEDLIFGIYATDNIVPNKILLDYYFLNFNSNKRRYNYAAGEENRQSYGVRIYSQKPTLNYELEATYQSGKFNQLNISAYGISADVNYKFIFRHNFIIGLGSNYMSGDKNKNDHQLYTYNSIFSKPPFGLIAPTFISIGVDMMEIQEDIELALTAGKLNLQDTEINIIKDLLADGQYSAAAIKLVDFKKPKVIQEAFLENKPTTEMSNLLPVAFAPERAESFMLNPFSLAGIATNKNGFSIAEMKYRHIVRTIFWTSFTQTFLIGIGIAVFGYGIFAEKFTGSVADMIEIFSWAFVLDVSINTLTTTAGGISKNIRS